jgi:hypothetical protein
LYNSKAFSHAAVASSSLLSIKYSFPRLNNHALAQEMNLLSYETLKPFERWILPQLIYSAPYIFDQGLHNLLPVEK